MSLLKSLSAQSDLLWNSFLVRAVSLLGRVVHGPNAMILLLILVLLFCLRRLIFGIVFVINEFIILPKISSLHLLW